MYRCTVIEAQRTPFGAIAMMESPALMEGSAWMARGGALSFTQARPWLLGRFHNSMRLSSKTNPGTRHDNTYKMHMAFDSPTCCPRIFAADYIPSAEEGVTP